MVCIRSKRPSRAFFTPRDWPHHPPPTSHYQAADRDSAPSHAKKPHSHLHRSSYSPARPFFIATVHRCTVGSCIFKLYAHLLPRLLASSIFFALRIVGLHRYRSRRRAWRVEGCTWRTVSFDHSMLGVGWGKFGLGCRGEELVGKVGIVFEDTCSFTCT